MAGLPVKFYVPWSKIDPSMQHGGIPNGLAGYVAPDLGDNPTTNNRSLVTIFYELNAATSAVSMHPMADVEGFPGRDLVEEALKAMQTFAERLITNTHTHATRFFVHTHCAPPTEHFKLNGIRYPLRNSFGDEFIYWCLATLVELAENNRNGAHKGLDPKGSQVVINALYSWKSDVMKFYFGKEVAGEISERELLSLFETINTPNPFYPDETAQTPSKEATDEALTGLDVLKWLPTDPDWSMFAQLETRRFTPERIFQPEGTDQTTEDVRSEQGHTAPGEATGGPTV